MMDETQQAEARSVSAMSLSALPWDDQEDFRSLCRRFGKNPGDFRVEVEEHAAGTDGSPNHHDVVVVYLPSGKGRCYCPDYGKFWTLKFGVDLKVDYFTPEDRRRRGLVVWP
jgi:hypothetical protein